MKKKELFSIRLEPSLAKEIDRLVRVKLETRSNILREALLRYIEREAGLQEIKRLSAKKYAEGSLSFEDLVRVIGYRDARKIVFFVDVAKRSFEEGLE